MMKLRGRSLAVVMVAVGCLAFSAAAQVTSGCGGGGSGSSGGSSGGNADLPSAVEGITATPGYGKITVTWQAEEGLTYNLYWGTSSDVLAALGSASVVRVEGATSPYELSTDCGATYAFSVTAVNADGDEGEASAVVQATPGATGVLDTEAFGTDGIVTIEEDTLRSAVVEMKTDAEGKLVLTGLHQRNALREIGMGAWRFTTAGVADTSLNTSGRITDFGSGADPEVGSEYRAGANVAFDSEGRLVVVMFYRPDEDSNYSLVVKRYSADGSVDTTFNGGEQLALSGSDTLSSINIPAVGLIVDASDGIAVAHRAKDGDEYKIAVWHLTEAGVEDWASHFPVTHSGDYGDQATQLAIDAEGRIVGVGFAAVSHDIVEMILFRLTADGVLDTTFGTDGVVIDEPSGSYLLKYGFGLALDAEGRILVSGVGLTGEVEHNVIGDYLVWRFDANGAPDTSFGDGGMVGGEIHAGANQLNYGGSILTDPVGGIILSVLHGGWDGVINAAVVRLDESGTVDPSFGTAGVIDDDLHAVSGNSRSWVAAQSFGCIYLAITEDTADGAQTLLQKIK